MWLVAFAHRHCDHKRWKGLACAPDTSRKVASPVSLNNIFCISCTPSDKIEQVMEAQTPVCSRGTWGSPLTVMFVRTLHTAPVVPHHRNLIFQGFSCTHHQSLHDFGNELRSCVDEREQYRTPVEPPADRWRRHDKIHRCLRMRVCAFQAAALDLPSR